MNQPSRNEQARQFYNAAGTLSTDFSFMNYGFAPLSAELSGSTEPEKYCLQLYRQLIGGTPLQGKRVVEVSCGRGGGAAHVAQGFGPADYLGIDISENNLTLASKRFPGVKNLRFQQGNAEALPLESGTIDVVLNVEASHLYDNPAKFFAEVHRVLVPGGRFLHVDLHWQDKDPPAMIAAAGFRVDEVVDITKNVVRALQEDSERREALVMTFPENMRKDFRDWSGVKDFRAYNRLKNGEWLYRITRATR
ncbi:MAG: methyltransferase type 11 [Steroidobacteraceae bacterium]|jgi:ubiquinone/menaquinone biosynthesis C-methylase UbiE|nr:methyltransferase type 11 [Steroidobacteraceae bacterium]